MAGLGLKKARTIVKAAFAKARAEGMKPLAVCVLDAGGHLVAGEREDGTSAGRFEVARAKAHGAVMMGLPGSAQQARAEQQPYFIAAMNGLFGGQVVPVKGGVLVRDGRGALIGAVGVSGDTSDNDAAVALAGIEAAGLSGEA